MGYRRYRGHRVVYELYSVQGFGTHPVMESQMDWKMENQTEHGVVASTMECQVSPNNLKD